MPGMGEKQANPLFAITNFQFKTKKTKRTERKEENVKEGERT